MCFERAEVGVGRFAGTEGCQVGAGQASPVVCEAEVITRVAGVGAADGVGPGDGSVGVDRGLPAGCLIEAVVSPAQGYQVRWGGGPAGRGDHVVEVADAGADRAAGEAVKRSGFNAAFMLAAPRG